MPNASHAAQVRSLKARAPFLTIIDISVTTGIPIGEVRAALSEQSSETAPPKLGMLPVYKMSHVAD